MLLSEIIIVYFEDRTKYMNTLCGQISEMFMFKGLDVTAALLNRFVCLRTYLRKMSSYELIAYRGAGEGGRIGGTSGVGGGAAAGGP
jgi:hypothetical protein